MTWELVVAKSAQKDLQKLPPRDRERVEAALLAMRENPFSGDIVRLKGHEGAAWRRRVGEYRILYLLYVRERLILVTAIRRRTSTTY
jgi:mRNA-degrading endonuclease RelE of RelBE toxin-antitoxin system